MCRAQTLHGEHLSRCIGRLAGKVSVLIPLHAEEVLHAVLGTGLLSGCVR